MSDRAKLAREIRAIRAPLHRNQARAPSHTAEPEIMVPVDILKLIPHRHPFLLVDRIVEMESDSSGTGIKSGIGVKNVSANEHYLAGQADPVMPPLLLLEGIAQTAAALLCMYHLAVGEPPLIYFMGIDKARFRRLVRPGEVIHYHVEKTQSRGRVWRYRGRAIVDGALAAHAEFSAVIAPAPESASS